MNAIDTIKHAGLTIEIHHDTDCPSPRENDNVGHMVFHHGRYTLGDTRVHFIRAFGESFRTPQEFAEWRSKPRVKRRIAVIIPVFMIDHSGLTLRAGSDFSDCDPGHWDSGQLGYIFCTRAEVRKEWNGDIEQARKYLLGEVEEYSRYIGGETYGYIIRDANGEETDSCWGFIGMEYAVEEAKQAADAHVRYVAKNEAEAGSYMAL